MNKLTQPIEAGALLCPSITSAYNALKNQPSVSLLHGFESNAFCFKDYAQGFSPHPDSANLVPMAKQYGEQFGIWLNNAGQYISCCLYLFPDAPNERMIPIVQNCAVDFYLNDVMGREMFPQLTAHEQMLSTSIVNRLSHFHPKDAKQSSEPVEQANAIMLKRISELSPANWFENFIYLYNKHISMAHRDPLPDGICPQLEDYFESRLHISGMPHTIALLEFANNNFLDWNCLEKANLSDSLIRLNRVVGLIGCLMNDLFSFEKEVIDNRTLSNLVAVLYSSNEHSKMNNSIKGAIKIVRNLLSEFALISRSLNNKLSTNNALAQETIIKVREYIHSLSKVVVASWYWQCATSRYKRNGSIFLETQL